MLRPLLAAAFAGVLLLPAAAWAESPFDGTWKSTAESTKPSKKPEVFRLKDGHYTCGSCSPSFTVAADGADHAVSGHPYFDTVAVTVVDDHTVRSEVKKAGKVVGTDTSTISPDGKTMTYEALSNMFGTSVKAKETLMRIEAGAAGSHAMAGAWRVTALDSLSDNALTETLRVTDNALTMTSPLGVSYTAKLDGSDAPNKGDAGVSSVSVRQLGARSIEETDKLDGKVVGVQKRTLMADGTTMQVSYTNKRSGRTESWTATKQ